MEITSILIVSRAYEGKPLPMYELFTSCLLTYVRIQFSFASFELFVS